MRRLKVILAPSKFMASDVASDFPQAKIRQLYNGIPLPGRVALPKRSTQTVLYVGRLASVKGVDHLVRSFAQVHGTMPHARLRIVGDGDRLQDLKDLAKELHILDCVEFPGWIVQQDIFKEYAAASLLAIPSVWPENLPTVAIEALAMGRPIVGSDVGGIPELVDNAKCGYLVSPSDETGLAKAITALLENPARLTSMSEAAHAKSTEFSDRIFIERIVAVYKEVSQS